MKHRLLTLFALAGLTMGTASAQLNKNKCKFLGNITTNGQINPPRLNIQYNDLWDQLTCENESKWGTIVNSKVSSAQEGVQKWNWRSADSHYNWCKQNGVQFKFHALCWTSQWPTLLADCTPEELRKQFEYWVEAVSIKYPDLTVIDVVNEAIQGHAENTEGGKSSKDFKNLLSRALGNSTNPYDYKWIAECFRIARKYFPNAVLIYNDYNTFTWQKNDFIDLVSSLVKQGAPIDAYGHQSHDLDDYYKNNNISNFGNTLKEIHQSITNKGGRELQCYITEFDISQGDDNTHLNIMKNTFTPMWEADFVSGITIWGFVNGSTWRSNTGLVTSSGADRASMKWLREYIVSDAAVNAKAKFCGKQAGGPSLVFNASESSIELGQSVTLTAEMEGASQFTYSIDGKKIGEGAKFVWTPENVGTYEITVETSANGEKVKRSVTVKVFKVGPYGGTVAAIPGTIEAENYDDGPAGVSYNDLSEGNKCDDFTNAYRSDDVDIKEIDGGYALGSCQKGEWMIYTVDVKQAGEYKVTIRVGEGSSSGKLTLSVGDVSQSITVDKTGSWGSFDEVEVKNMTLKAGEQKMKITIEQDWIDLDWVKFTSATGVSETVVSNVAIVPNPASNLIEITGVDNLKKVEILNLTGSVVLTSSNTKINTSNLDNGMYLVRITSDAGVYNKKLIVKK